jgi:hypothetical protein
MAAKPANTVSFVVRKESLMADSLTSPCLLLSVATEAEAAGIATALAEYGIEAMTTGGVTAGFKAEAPGSVQILVRAADFEQAKRALAEIRADEGHIDWSKVDVGQPEDE